jgi:hypothetical protein
MRPKSRFREPTARYGYIDKIQFWVIHPLDPRALDLLRAECGKGGISVKNEPARFNYRFRQRVQLRQPTEKAFRLLSRRNDVLINGVEVALDLVFKNWCERDTAIEFFHEHLVRRWHGSHQEIRVYRPQQEQAAHDHRGECRYDAGRSAPNKLVVYPEEFSRVTGEADCLHIEWRTTGARATRAIGIESPRDLLRFDYRGFWQKRLLLYDVDRRKLGRMLRNRWAGQRRRTPEVTRSGKYEYHVDSATGEVCMQIHQTVQELIDKRKSACRVHRALIPLSNETLLPPTHISYIPRQLTNSQTI